VSDMPKESFLLFSRRAHQQVAHGPDADVAGHESDAKQRPLVRVTIHRSGSVEAGDSVSRIERSVQRRH